MYEASKSDSGGSNTITRARALGQGLVGVMWMLEFSKSGIVTMRSLQKWRSPQ
jgi:hypothetical protein